MEITDTMIERRARQLALKYEGMESAWQRYYGKARAELREELKDA